MLTCHRGAIRLKSQSSQNTLGKKSGRLCCGKAVLTAEQGTEMSPQRPDQFVEVLFSLPYRCKFGQNLCIAGSAAKLGAWKVDECLDMEWSEGNIWRTCVPIPARDREGRVLRWKPGQNYRLQISDSGFSNSLKRVVVEDSWDCSTQDIEVLLHEEKPTSLNISEDISQLENDVAEALADLRMIVADARALLKTADVVSEEALDADRRVAEASQKAQILAKLLRETKRGQLH